MFKKILLTLAFPGNALLFAQTDTLKGKIVDYDNGEGISFANVVLMQDSSVVFRTMTDINGNFIFPTVFPTTYDINVNSLGYLPMITRGVVVALYKNNYQEIKIKSSGIRLPDVDIISYKEPVLVQSMSCGATITRQEYQVMPSKNVNAVSSRSAGIFKARGSRKKESEYYIDGSAVSGASVINQSPVQQIVPITGGIPAQYGDVAGGFVEPNTEQYNRIGENEFEIVTKSPLSTFSIDVDKAAYSNFRRFVTDGSLPVKDAVRIEEMINYFSYSYPKPREHEPFSINLESSECPWNKQHRLVHIGLQGKKIETRDLLPGNLVFLIDVSGSMDVPDKLPLLKASFKLLVEQLREQDKVSIVVYAGNAGLVLEPTRGNKKEKIYEAIDALQAGGSTAGGAGIQLAYKIAKENFSSKANNRVILATDGDFNVGVSSDEELVKLIEEKRNDGIFLSVVGFGSGNYKDSKMEQLADKGNGNYAYVDNLLEGKKVFVKEIGGTLYTIAKDVKIQVEFNPAQVKAYRLIGYENRMLEAEDFNNDRKDAGEIGSGHAVTALYEIIPASSDEEICDIDPLKYQRADTCMPSLSNEMMTLKFRYKEPADTVSKLLVCTLGSELTPFEKVSENFLFSASVAELGLLLRSSKFKSGSSYENVLALAKKGKGSDEDGYRAEFIRLAETCELLDKAATEVSKK